MSRLVLAAAVLMSMTAAACEKPQPGIATVEDAEAFAMARGVVLTDKTEDAAQGVAPRAYDYKAGAVEVGIIQFHTAKAAATWKEMMDGLPMASETRVRKGAVVFQIWGATDAERQDVIAALKGTKMMAAPPPRKAQTGVLSPDVEGYQDLRWGMSVEDVKARVPDLVATDNGGWGRQGIIAGFTAYTVVQFKNGKLKRVIHAVQDTTALGLSRPELQDAIVAALAQKYGPPTPTHGQWSETRSWSNAVTTIEVVDGIHGPVISYASRELMAEVERVPADGL
jgi:hypothetical protein